MLLAPHLHLSLPHSQQRSPAACSSGTSRFCHQHSHQLQGQAVQRCRSSSDLSSTSSQLHVCRAATLDRPETAAPVDLERVGFHTGEDGWLYCDGSKIDDIRQQVNSSPFYLYSKSKLQRNYAAYAEALHDIPAIIGYAIKANNNLHILKELSQSGSGAVLVSGNELQLAMAAGFDASR